jgi:hypothetical protein
MRREVKRSLIATVVILSVARVALADLRVVTRYSQTGGSASEHTTYFKGVRQREELKLMGKDGKLYDSAYIYQCDLKRLLWVDNVNHLYFDEPYKSMEEAWAEYYQQLAVKTKAGQPEKYKGTWTETVTVVDTGERREMFGFTARHIKTITVSDASPKACDQSRLRQETDGWYIDLLYGTECSSDISGYLSVGFLAPGGYNSCAKFYEKRNYRYERKQVGAARFGYPVRLAIRAYSNDGRSFMETTREVTEITRIELDQSLFELPEGYARLEPQPMKRSILDRALSLFR